MGAINFNNARYNSAASASFVEVMKHTGCSAVSQIRLYSLEHDFVIHHFKPTLSCLITKVLEPSGNYVINCPFSLHTVVVSVALWFTSSNWLVSYQIRLCCTFICTSFKSQTERSNEHVSVLTTAGTFHRSNCFSHIYATHKNIPKYCITSPTPVKRKCLSNLPSVIAFVQNAKLAINEQFIKYAWELVRQTIVMTSLQKKNPLIYAAEMPGESSCFYKPVFIKLNFWC